MALSIIKPFVHVEDANGNPYVGAKLYVYLPGTTTLASIYSDEGLSIALSNPLTGVTGSDAAGNFPRAYIAAGNYKLRAETSAGVLIWEYDNIDTGLSAGSGALPITSGGTGGITATQARTNLDVPSNSELAALATDITDIQSTLQNIVSVPQGYLTPTTGVPIIASDVISGTAVYYTPFIGKLIPIWDGLQFNTRSFAELTLTLNSNHTASNIYDVFVVEISGVLTLVTGPAWNTATAGAGARGTGAGTTELTRTKGGLYTNAFTMTARNGATTYPINANCGTYVGSLLIDGTNGQVTCHVTAGQSRKWAIWNAYNRVPLLLQMVDTTASWTYTTLAWRQSRNDATNTITVFTGLPEERIFMKFVQQGSTTDNNTTSQLGIAVAVNSTNTPAGRAGSHYTSIGAIALTRRNEMYAEHTLAPAIGMNNINAIENGFGGNSGVFTGTSASMLMTAAFRG